jgi:lipid II:glycine glycyltransferase (peptidoglycan interpeptide bridge formation enzyme)
MVSDTPEWQEFFSLQHFRRAPMHMHTERSWILSLIPSEESLLSSMRKTTRYAIRRAQKEGVTIEESALPDDVDRFLPLYEKTVSRQGFTPFSREYLLKKFQAFATGNHARWFFSLHEGKTIAAAMILLLPHAAFYHHGASDPAHARIPAAHLLQWKVICRAKQQGCREYNFWGIAPEGEPKHPWAGISLFKKGFGGADFPYLHAQDKVLSKRYWFNWVVESMRRIKRGY